jgi:hypothetical protein
MEATHTYAEPVLLLTKLLAPAMLPLIPLENAVSYITLQFQVLLELASELKIFHNTLPHSKMLHLLTSPTGIAQVDI